jgi:prepilin-type N-terminal cleavage/methylation domain-containing protein
MKKAFSLIELVLAIVIIAISVMTIPLMLAQSSNNNSFALMQESILAARTKMGNILTYEWDANSTIAVGTDTYIRVLDVRNGDNELDRNDTLVTILDENRRTGHVAADKRRRFHDQNLTTPAGMIFPSQNVDNANPTNINDFHQQASELSNGRGDFDYVMDFNMTTTISYVSDEADYSAQSVDFNFSTSGVAITDINSTNIKMIDIFVQMQGNSSPFRLRSYSCNIGQAELLERDVVGN